MPTAFGAVDRNLKLYQGDHVSTSLKQTILCERIVSAQSSHSHNCFIKKPRARALALVR